MNNSEKNDPAWKLLGSARKVVAGPFFSRNVVREIRKLQESGKDRPGVFESILAFVRQPLVSGVAAAVAILAVITISTEPGPDPVIADLLPPAAEFNPAREIESIEYLGKLMSVSDPDDLDDAALADLSLLASY